MAHTPGGGGGGGSTIDHGMKVEEVRSSASTIKTKAGEIEAKTNEALKVANKLKSDWLGSDSDQFQNDWTQAKKKLDLVVTDLKEFAKLANTEADEQEKTSKQYNK